MSGCQYRLNGHLLSRTGVQDVVTSHQASVQWDGQTTRTDGSGLVHNDFGPGAGRFTITFKLINRGNGPDEADFIYNEVKDSPWTLGVEDTAFTKTTTLFRNHKRLAFATRSVSLQPSRRYNVLNVQVDAILLGAWCGDGGDYVHLRRGEFEQVGANLINEDGDTVPDFVITLPEQAGGYPKARRTSDNALVQLTATGSSSETTRDGELRQVETYDLSGFLWPADPSTDGDTGVWEVQSCPSKAYLLADVNTVPGEGIGSESIASFSIGTA